MKKIFIVANWKSNKTEKEAIEYFQRFEKIYKPDSRKQVIFCPPFTNLSSLSELFKTKFFNIKLGAQDVSSFPAGSFTGSINAQEISEFCSYCIVGHSERRALGEDSEIVNKKINNLIENNIKPIVCISSLDQLDELENQEKCMIAYEPLDAIGSGHPQDASSVQGVATVVKKKYDIDFLYGGSVNMENVSSFTLNPRIDGVLVGGESLNPDSFWGIISNA